MLNGSDLILKNDGLLVVAAAYRPWVWLIRNSHGTRCVFLTALHHIEDSLFLRSRLRSHMTCTICYRWDSGGLGRSDVSAEAVSQHLTIIVIVSSKVA